MLISSINLISVLGPVTSSIDHLFLEKDWRSHCVTFQTEKIVLVWKAFGNAVLSKEMQETTEGTISLLCSFPGTWKGMEMLLLDSFHLYFSEFANFSEKHTCKGGERKDTGIQGNHLPRGSHTYFHRNSQCPHRPWRLLTGVNQCRPFHWLHFPNPSDIEKKNLPYST